MQYELIVCSFLIQRVCIVNYFPFYNNASNARLISIQNTKYKHQNDILSKGDTKEQTIVHQTFIYDALILMTNGNISEPGYAHNIKSFNNIAALTSAQNHFFFQSLF